MSWNDALLRYTLALSDIPPDLFVFSSDRFVVIKDGFPKSTFHYLILPLPLASSPPLTRSSLESINQLGKLPKQQALDLLDGIEDTAREVEHLIQGEMRKMGAEWEIVVGFHAVPSMKHLHVHVISKDLCSAKLKNKKHYNSFHPDLGFFLELQHVRAMVEAGDKEALSFSPAKYEPLLKLPLKSVWTAQEFKTIPALKAHLEKQLKSIKEGKRG